jgi:hypothetical protein
VHTHSIDPKSLGDGGRTVPGIAHFTDLGDRVRRFTTFVDALGLGGFDAACCRYRRWQITRQAAGRQINLPSGKRSHTRS